MLPYAKKYMFGAELVQIHDSEWKCPRCGVGAEAGEGLTLSGDQHFKGWEFNNYDYPDTHHAECLSCGWEGTAGAIAKGPSRKRRGQLPA